MSDKKFRWALYQVDTTSRMFEIDVEPAMTREAAIIKVIFRGNVVPKGVTLRSTLYVDFERWRVEWAAGQGKDMMGSLNAPFVEFLVKSHLYGKGWRERALHERIQMQLREIETKAWWATPQEQLGKRSPNEIVDLKPGPCEVVGQGFLWVGQDKFEFHPMFESDGINKDVKWYLERGTSLSEAIGLNVRQAKRINAQMIAGLAMALASRPSIGSGTVWANIADTMGVLTSTDQWPNPSARHALKEAVDSFSSHPDERRIQQLAKKTTIPLVRLSSKK